MTQPIELLEGKTVFVDARTGELGGSFYYNPHLQPYSPLPIKWAFEKLIVYPKATLIDVGASTGAFTLLSRHHPELYVHAFEPVALSNAVLRENVSLNALGSKVTVNQVAVSNYNGEGVLHSIRQIGGSGVSMVDGNPNAGKDCADSTIPVVTLDSYCALHDVVPTMIKIDVEGAELMVLNGAYETIIKYKPFIIVEYSQENAEQYDHYAREIIEFIEDLGYVWLLPEVDILAVHKDWQGIS